jgi:aminopeptidase
MTDLRLRKFAQILVDHSTKVKPGDRVAITSSTAAEPFMQALYELILERGAHPHVLLELAGQEETFFAHANDTQLDLVPIFHKLAFEEFEVLIKVRAETNTRALGKVDLIRQSRRQKALATLLDAQMRRGADDSLRWMSTIYPTNAYAIEAEMGYAEYQDFVFGAMHADENTPDPVGYWQGVERDQARIVQRIEGHQWVVLRGPNVDLSLSIKGRKFRNAAGQHNMPDGEIYTGPVEDSANGWVCYSYPAIYQNRAVDGIELTYESGKVINATAEKNEEYLLMMLDTDPGACYLGEFAIGTNMEITRFTRSILFDEKIGGSFHTALGAGYPETGSLNKSAIHWDMICDMRQDSEILVDGELFYKNGQFLLG